jgi:histidinol dehydrogenase
MNISQLNYNNPDFYKALDRALAWDVVSDKEIESTVEQIIADIKERGDQALLDYTRKFDGVDANSISELVLNNDDLEQSLQRITGEQREALNAAAKRIRDYHQHQEQPSWQYQQDGILLGQQVTPIARVGVYVPGGKAAYPSTVLMNVIPANVAGVDDITMVVPAPKGQVNDMVLAAAAIAKVDRVITVGGAQAIAALAYGTESIAKVDKIVGPGNIFVATAKKQVFGVVGIDMIAGPSEILVLCDGKTDPEWITMDLFSQAEHDEKAQSILISPDQEFLDEVQRCAARRINEMDRQAIIRQSLADRGLFIHAPNMEAALEISNYIAPEHLELSVDNPELYLPAIKNAGAIFMGRYNAEVLGDYCAGPNHVLPTSGTARFSSPLGVYDFQKRSSLIMCSPQAASELGKTASVLARSEGLQAHARSAEFRIKND